MKIKKLLFVTKFEELGYDALNSLLGLRKAGLEHVIFLYVIEREKVAMQRGVGYQKSEQIRLKEAANIRFIDWAERLFEEGMEVGVYIQVGSLAAEVVKAARREEADLVVIGRSHKGALEQFYAGSTVVELIRRLSIPVLVYKPAPEGPCVIEKPFDRPLLATDWSPASFKAVEYLKELKGVAQEIRVVHVVDDKQISGASVMDAQKTRKETKQKLDEICALFEAEGISARPHVYVGDPEQQIDVAARECEATLIVLGSSAKAAWVERFIGSTPREIAETSAFPTLLIPPQKEQ
jgi:nucleotide-binding universal stress UspA family protein